MKLWIRIDVAIRSDPNVAELAARLDISLAEAVGYCTLMWSAIAEHCPNGDVSRLSKGGIGRMAAYTRPPHRAAKPFADIWLELFTSNGRVRGWETRQGKLVQRAEADRLRKSGGIPRNSEEIPRKKAPTERNVTEQTTSLQSAREARVLLPKQFEPDFDELMSRVPNATAWSAEIASAPEGLNSGPGKPPTWIQIGQAIRDYNANAEDPNLAHFRGYLRRATAEPKGGSVRSTKRNGKQPQEYDYPNLTDPEEKLNWQT